MGEADKHEWASGVHAAIFSMATVLAAVYWHSRIGLWFVFVSQALAYLSRVFILMNMLTHARIAAGLSVIVAGFGAFAVLDEIP